MDFDSEIRKAICDLISKCPPDITARIAKAITPGSSAALVATQEIASAVRQGCEACRSLVQKQFLVDRLLKAIGKDAVEPSDIASVLNWPFTKRLRSPLNS